MKGSTDPVVKNFWTEISFVPLEPFPYNEVQYTSTGWRLPTWARWGPGMRNRPQKSLLSLCTRPLYTMHQIIDKLPSISQSYITKKKFLR